VYTGCRLVSIADVVRPASPGRLTLTQQLRILSRPFSGRNILLYSVYFSGRYGAEHEAHISTEQPPSQEDPWLPCAHGDEERARHRAQSARQRPQASVGLNARQAGPAPGFPDNGLPRRGRLTKKSQFDAVHRRGTRSSDSLFRVLAIPNNEGRPRLGLAVGNAVKRNRVKRLVREYFRTTWRELPAVDLVVNARSAAGQATWTDVAASLGEHWAKVRRSCA
jgi:ribonuclease P protein component